jgi:Icc protein
MSYQKIAYITDTHLEEAFPKTYDIDAQQNFARILADVKAKGIQSIIIGGDIGEKSANPSFFESLKGFDVSLTLGNHDYFEEVVKHFDKGAQNEEKALYSATEGAIFKKIYLDSSAGAISDRQLNWLKKELITTQKILLFIHHPILKVESEMDEKYGLKNRAAIIDALTNIKQEVNVFCGHYHFEDKRSFKNIRQYISPASSFQVVKIPNKIIIENSFFGYRIIEIKEGELETEVVLFRD